MTDLSQLEPGRVVFVEMSAHSSLPGQLFPGVVQLQQWEDQTVRVQTEAAQEVHKAWKGMSFRWSTGLGYSYRWARLIVPADDAEIEDLEQQMRIHGKAYAARLERGRYSPVKKGAQIPLRFPTRPAPTAAPIAPAPSIAPASLHVPSFSEPTWFPYVDDD